MSPRRRSRQSLESAVYGSESTVITRETESAIIIDSSAFASRKRGRVALSTLSNVPIQMNQDGMMGNVTSDKLFWREKYDEMVVDRAASETNYTRQLELHMEKERKLCECIELLEQKIRKIVKHARNGYLSDEEHTTSMSSEDEKNLIESQQLVALYQQLTGATVTREGDAYTCTVKNKSTRQMVCFSLKTCADDSFEMVPDANAHLLPEYLQTGVTFAKTLAPLMLADVLSGLFAEE